VFNSKAKGILARFNIQLSRVLLFSSFDTVRAIIDKDAIVTHLQSCYRLIPPALREGTRSRSGWQISSSPSS
jgi:hypothetical protein